LFEKRDTVQIKVKPQTLSLDDLMLDKIIIKQDINVLLEILKNDYIDSNCLKNVSLIHVIESSSNIDKIKELLEVLKSKELENEINKKDQKGFTVLDKMLSKCSAKFVKEMLDLGFEISSKDKIEEILKSKKESLKKVIFENDKLRDSLTIESLKFDENYKSFFEKLTNGDIEVVEEVVRVFNDYAINKSPYYDLQFDDKKIRLNPFKLIEFIKESSKKEDIESIGLGFGGGKVSSSKNIFEELQQKLTGDLKIRFNESFQKVNQPTSGAIKSGGVASLVFLIRPNTENSMI
jgi:hypothetical protein